MLPSLHHTCIERQASPLFDCLSSARRVVIRVLLAGVSYRRAQVCTLTINSGVNEEKNQLAIGGLSSNALTALT